MGRFVLFLLTCICVPGSSVLCLFFPLEQLGHGDNELRIGVPTVLNRFSYPDSVATVTAGKDFTGVVTISNKVFMWGAGGESLPQEKLFFSNPEMMPRALAAGMSHVAVLLKDHRIYSWGSNYMGQLGLSEEKFFTLEPQLIEDLVNKRVTLIACGMNHSLALSAKPFPLACPVFRDWYGSQNEKFSMFIAECHVDDHQCPDGSCCKAGQSCSAFSPDPVTGQVKYGCCGGENMKFCEDDTTCCPKNAKCDLTTLSCEVPVSYFDAAKILKKFASGQMKPIAALPGSHPHPTTVSTDPDSVTENSATTTHPETQAANSENPANQVSSVADSVRLYGHDDIVDIAASRTVEKAYAKYGLTAASKASLEALKESTRIRTEELSKQAVLERQMAQEKNSANVEVMKNPPVVKSMDSPAGAQSPEEPQVEGSSSEEENDAPLSPAETVAMLKHHLAGNTVQNDAPGLAQGDITHNLFLGN